MNEPTIGDAEHRNTAKRWAIFLLSQISHDSMKRLIAKMDGAETNCGCDQNQKWLCLFIIRIYVTSPFHFLLSRFFMVLFLFLSQSRLPEGEQKNFTLSLFFLINGIFIFSCGYDSNRWVGLDHE